MITEAQAAQGSVQPQRTTNHVELPVGFYVHFSPMPANPEHMPWAVRRIRTAEEMADEEAFPKDPVKARGATEAEVVEEFMRRHAFDAEMKKKEQEEGERRHGPRGERRVRPTTPLNADMAADCFAIIKEFIRQNISTGALPPARSTGKDCHDALKAIIDGEHVVIDARKYADLLGFVDNVINAHTTPIVPTSQRLEGRSGRLQMLAERATDFLYGDAA